MKLNKNLLTATLFTVGIFATISNANAATTTGGFDVKLDITETCQVSSASGTQDIEFGSYAAGVDVVEASSTTDISVNCSNATAYNIGLLGTGMLTDEVSGNSVEYTLLKSSGGAVWGNTTTEVGGTGTGMSTAQAKQHKVFASLVPGSTNDLTAGSYTDNVLVTVTY